MRVEWFGAPTKYEREKGSESVEVACPYCWWVWIVEKALNTFDDMQGALSGFELGVLDCIKRGR